ncbi:MAG: aminotransferase class IV [Bacteroidetes bacterium]|nr:aminotransferase class IV [Bacteroidota bacterium]
MDFIHQFIIRNGEIYPNVSEKLTNDTTIYEVIRIIDGIPLFFEQHYYRLGKSARLINKRLDLSEEKLKQLIHTLINANKQYSGNIKIIVDYDNETGLSLSKIGFIEHNYPTEKEYAEGVKTVSYTFQRPNPNAKIQYPNFRNDVHGLMQNNNAYEIILVNPDGNITEGSRSNLFFIMDNILYTAPEKEVLTGITRNVFN